MTTLDNSCEIREKVLSPKYKDSMLVFCLNRDVLTNDDFNQQLVEDLQKFAAKEGYNLSPQYDEVYIPTEGISPTVSPTVPRAKPAGLPEDMSNKMNSLAIKMRSRAIEAKKTASIMKSAVSKKAEEIDKRLNSLHKCGLGTVDTTSKPTKTDIEEYIYGKRDRLTKSYPPLSKAPKKDTHQEIIGLQERSARVKQKMENLCRTKSSPF